MKPLRKHFKLIALFLAVTFLLQSCKVYDSRTVTTDEAILFCKSVKISSEPGENFKFQKLFRKDGKLYGLANRNSNTTKRLSGHILNQSNTSENNKYVIIEIPEYLINRIQLQDEYLSHKSTDLAIEGIFQGTMFFLGKIAGF